MLDSPSSIASRPVDYQVSQEEVLGAIENCVGFTPQVHLEYEPDNKILWLTIRPEPKPVFTLQLLASVGKVQAAINELWGAPSHYVHSPVRFLAYRGEGPIFTLGGDLDFYLECLAHNDRAALEEYVRLSIDGACFNASAINASTITISTISGKALGGGIDAPRSCNIMVAEKSATFCYPEMKFNHFPITAIYVLSRHLGPQNAARMLLSGEELAAEDFEKIGGLQAVVEDGAGEDWIRSYARENLSVHSARVSLFAALHNQATNMRDALTYQGQLWVEGMMRLSPMEISRLQRIAQTQDKMLARLYRKKESVPAE
ncbi:MAG: enoyl-CoA hydratase/isomerase family protein [Hyphomicrobiales bacterium]|nr:enoyl-CoA hydratase/isomerase family protein [Hyphomicrobiales bacterium]